MKHVGYVLLLWSGCSLTAQSRHSAECVGANCLLEEDKDSGVMVPGDGAIVPDAGFGLDASTPSLAYLCGTTESLRDTFKGPLSALWLSDGDVSSSRNPLQLRATSSAIAFIESESQYLFDETRLIVEVDGTASPAVGDWAVFVASLDPDTYALISIERPTSQTVLRFGIQRNGERTTLAETVYSPAAHHFWQMRAAGGDILFSTSSNGADWVTQAQAASNVAGKPVNVRIGSFAATPVDFTFSIKSVNGLLPDLSDQCR